MSFDALIAEVYEANKALGESGLVVLTWGNVSAVDRRNGVMAIKPSGVPYSELDTQSIVVVDLESGETVAGSNRPSSDTPTHLDLYRGFPQIGGIVHTHSEYATAWAQAAKPIPCLGTTHADSFHGRIPVTRNLNRDEIAEAYEAYSGKVIIEHFDEQGLDPTHTPGVLLPHHGPFTWGKNALKALEHSIILEAVAKMAYLTRTIDPSGPDAPSILVEKHFGRKHGPDAYYGQK